MNEVDYLLQQLNDDIEHHLPMDGMKMEPLNQMGMYSDMFTYPDFPSPPETPSLTQMEFNWDSKRTMSLPHIQYPQYKFTSARKVSLSSTGSEKNMACSHPGCDRTFSRVQNLRSHMRCHLVTAPHSCQHCGLGFRRTTDLQRHIRTMHTPNDQKPWACAKCPKRFGRSDALKRHMTSKSKDHGCPGGPDLQLLQQMEEQRKMKRQKKALAVVQEGSIF